MDNFVKINPLQNIANGVNNFVHGNPIQAGGDFFKGTNVMGAGSFPLVDMATGMQPNNNGSSGFDNSIQPNYSSSYDPSMAQLPGYEQHIAENSAGTNKFKNQAMSDTASPWATIANQANQQNATNAMDKAAGASAGATAGAVNQIAATGGLSSGARERVIEGGAHNLMNMQQGIQQNAGTNATNIGMQDAQIKQQELSQLPGMEFGQNNAWQSVRGGDQANQLNENQNKNAFNLTKYAAGQQANATANSAPKGKK